MNIAIPIFDGLTALDAVGPYEVLSRLPGASVHFIAAETGPKRTETAMLALTADRTLDELPDPEVIVVPGGFGTRALMHDEEMLSWLRTAHWSSQWTTSVCTGSLLLAAAGILDGLEATTHWLELETLRLHGATPVNRRVVRAGEGDHGGRRLLRDRHGARAHGADRGSRACAGDPAGDRVRPAAAVRLGLDR